MAENTTALADKENLLNELTPQQRVLVDTLLPSLIELVKQDVPVEQVLAALRSAATNGTTNSHAAPEPAEAFPFHEIGSITGILKDIDLEEKTFFIYFPDDRPKVLCLFEDDLKAIVTEADGQRVEVNGRLNYQHDDYAQPDLVQVEEIEIFPPDDTLPTLSSLHGIEPNLLRGKSLQEVIWEIKDAWGD